MSATPTPDPRALVDRAVALARRWQERAAELQTPQERRQQAELDRMLQDPGGKATLLQMTDQAFRARSAGRSADQLTHILDVQGIPRFFSPLDRTLLRGFQSFGGALPGVAVPLVKEKMQHETANVVLPAEPELLGRHLRARRDEGVRMNVNFLGEALLGEGEAERRLQGYLQALQEPDVEVISVKISTLFSQISSLAREDTLRTLCDRLELLYRAAARARFRRADGSVVPKFVYLDMEEYRDMAITADAFVRTLERPGLDRACAGLALQAYLPDSFAVQRRITEWAMGRVADGGAPVTLRIVKGANMEMERVEASLRGWPAAPFQRKVETDASYKRMLRYALEPEHARAVAVGVASHNLFELAHAVVLAEANGMLDRIQLEMLEGMANHQRRALFEDFRNLLLYAPACRHEDFVHAIGYLVRRLDENAGPDNFLRHAFQLVVGSDEWCALEADFRSSFDEIGRLPDTPRRTQDRRRPPVPAIDPRCPWERFVGEPDTDFSLLHNCEWAARIADDWRDRCGERALEVPLAVGGAEIFEDRPVLEDLDPSRPGTVVARARLATDADVENALDCATRDADGWRTLAVEERGRILRRAAQRIRERRADLMGMALAEAGKILPESDPEVSEAVDFVELYARTAESAHALPGIDAGGRGVVVVVPPWNFPIAIPCGGVAAALAAGNTAILKPAPETPGCARILCECFWDAGVPRRVLQMLCAENATTATRLVTHDAVDTVVFTGGTATARHLHRLRPDMRLLAETGGKNAMIVTAVSDRDLAIAHTVRSAFGHSGQKCSAASLLILEREVYEDPGFRDALCDATVSLPVGSAWEPTTRVGPLIRPPRGPLESALKELEPGETWAVRPRFVAGHPQLVTPGIKWGVTPGSATHLTELFGPVLGVLCADDLDHAIELAHQTGYGLTAGLQSLDDREQERFARRMRAGNLYVNRGITGAVVLRQPFGGMGRSAVGPGIKAGGPNYVLSLMRIGDRALPGADREPGVSTGPGGGATDPLVDGLLRALEERTGGDPGTLASLRAAEASARLWMEREFGREHDHFRLVGQDNVRRYRPVPALRIRVQPEDSDFDVFARVVAARAAGCTAAVSSDPASPDERVAWLHEATGSWAGAIEFIEESDDELASAIREGCTDRIRYAGARVPDPVRRAAAEAGLHLATDPVLVAGRIELLHYLVEQSLSVDYHRYGNLGARAGEDRSPVS